jgi:hypothetical protein
MVPVIVDASTSEITVSVVARPPPLLHVPSPFAYEWTNPVVLLYVPSKIGP